MGRLPHRCLSGHRTDQRGLEPIQFRAKPYPVEAAFEIERATGLSHPVATVLARRGLTTPAAAGQFLAAGESHDPFEFSGMSSAASTVLDAIRAGRQITIYGDFDCDGVCATTILVSCIRDLGGSCDWFIPDRIADGYGLNAEAIRALKERGSELLITVDCGVTAVEEVALARDIGLDILVTDHHQAGPVLPDCPVLHPEISKYPFPSLCGAAVAAKLASAIRREAGEDGERDESDLDLVALATVTDVMPLVGENRHLVKEGVKVARRGHRVGLAALIAETKIEASRLAAEDFGFRIGPRINAAGRLYRADAGVELFLAADRDRGAEIARELSAVNSERRRIEQGVESEAKAELKEMAEVGPAVVVAGEGWHPGVVGIVASKLVKATGRPSVVISLEGEMGRGSARSVPGLDLHQALEEVSGLLESFGGHAAAAGLSIRAEKVDAFREALGEAVAKRIGTEPVEVPIAFDLVAGGSQLGLDLAEEIEQVAPFGNGNPGVSVLIPNATIEDIQTMGEGKHCRFTIRSGTHRARGVAFGRTSFGVDEGERADVVAELGINHWNGSIEPQLRVREVRAAEPAEPLPTVGDQEWWERFDRGLSLELPDLGPVGEYEVELATVSSGPPGVALADLISSGERTVILTADARRRWIGLGGAGLARMLPEGFESGEVIGVWDGSPSGTFRDAASAQVLLTDFAALRGEHSDSFGSDLLDGFDRIALLDPPFTAAATAILMRSKKPVHLLGGVDEFGFSARAAAHRLDLTGQLRALYREFRDGGFIDDVEATASDLRSLLESDGDELRSPEEAAMLLRVLIEAGLARTGGEGSARGAGVVSSEGADLSASAVFVHHLSLHKEHERFLNHFHRLTQQ